MTRLRFFAPFAAGTAALAVLTSCSTAPLASYERLAVAPPLVQGARGAEEARISDLVTAAIVDGIHSSGRFICVDKSSEAGPETAVVHARIREFEPASPDSTGQARAAYLLTDLSGRPLAGGSRLSLARFCEGADQAQLLAGSIGRDFSGFLRQVGGPGRPARICPEGAARECVISPAKTRSDWLPGPGIGRIEVRFSLSASSAGTLPAGSGKGSPSWGDAFSPGPGWSAGVFVAPCPGLRAGLSGGLHEFSGRNFESSGLTVEFSDLRLYHLCGAVRLLLPLSGQPGRRWWRTWDPFTDTRGINAAFSASAGLGRHGSVYATVVEDRSGETPVLLPGDRMDYFSDGALVLGELSFGLEARFGEERGPLFIASLSAGLFAAAPPAAAGKGAEAEMMAGWTVSMGIGAAL